MKSIILAAVLLVGLAPNAHAQASPCDTDTTGPFIVTTGRAFTVSWCQLVAVVAPDGSVLNRYSGFYLQIDNGPKIDVGLPSPGILSLVTNRLQYSIATAGVQKGAHTATLSTYVFIIDDSGAITSQRLESAPAAVPFTAVDTAINTIPSPPSGIRITR